MNDTESSSAGAASSVGEIWDRLAGGTSIETLCSASPGLTRDCIVLELEREAAELRAAIDELSTVLVGSRPDAPEIAYRELPRGFTLADSRIAEMMYEVDLLRGIRAGLQDVVAGRLVPHEEVMAELRRIICASQTI